MSNSEENGTPCAKGVITQPTDAEGDANVSIEAPLVGGEDGPNNPDSESGSDHMGITEKDVQIQTLDEVKALRRDHHDMSKALNKLNAAQLQDGFGNQEQIGIAGHSAQPHSLDQDVSGELWESIKPPMGEEVFDEFWEWVQHAWMGLEQFRFLTFDGKLLQKPHHGLPDPNWFSKFIHWFSAMKPIALSSWLKSMPGSKGEQSECADSEKWNSWFDAFDLFAHYDLGSSKADLRFKRNHLSRIPHAKDESRSHAPGQRSGSVLCVSSH